MDPVCTLTSHSLLNLRKNSSFSNLLLWSGTTRGIVTNTFRPLQTHFSALFGKQKRWSSGVKVKLRVRVFPYVPHSASLSLTSSLPCLSLSVCVCLFFFPVWSNVLSVIMPRPRLLRAPGRLWLQMALIKWPTAIDKAEFDRVALSPSPSLPPSLSSSISLSWRLLWSDASGNKRALSVCLRLPSTCNFQVLLPSRLADYSCVSRDFFVHK